MAPIIHRRGVGNFAVALGSGGRGVRAPRLLMPIASYGHCGLIVGCDVVAKGFKLHMEKNRDDLCRSKKIDTFGGNHRMLVQNVQFLSLGVRERRRKASQSGAISPSYLAPVPYIEGSVALTSAYIN